MAALATMPQLLDVPAQFRQGQRPGLGWTGPPEHRLARLRPLLPAPQTPIAQPQRRTQGPGASAGGGLQVFEHGAGVLREV